MTTLAPPHPSAPAADGAPPDDLFAHVLSANPFTDNRVSGPGQGAADVDEIHRAAFERLTALAREACAARRGLGAVLWGEAGVGKSHVLARLARWAADDHAPFVYLHNLQASPDTLPRSVLRAVVSTLTHGWAARFARTPLFRLVAAFAHEAFGYDPSARPSWTEIGRACARLIDREAARGGQAALVDRTTYAVLLRFFQSAHAAGEGRPDGVAALAVRWLGGDYLDPAEAARLRLAPAAARGEPVGLADNQRVKQVLLALTRLALGARRPFLLCFDQVDNLDDEQVASLARFLEALLDAAPNLLVVSAGVQATLLHWRQARVIQDSAWDRLAQFEVALQRITPAEAERIVAARLACFFEPWRGRAALPQGPLFPLGEAWRAEALRDKIDLRPRDVINRAREGFRREQEALLRNGGPAWLATWGRRPPEGPTAEPAPSADEAQRGIDQRVARQLADLQARRRERPDSLPPDADNLAGLVAALLGQCRAASPEYGIAGVERPAAARAGARLPYDLLLRRRRTGGEEERTCLLFVVTANAQSATGFLRRLIGAIEPGGRLFLVTDERCPLALGATGQRHLRQLRRGRTAQFRQVELTFTEYAELDALREVVGLARSGDLEVGAAPRPLSKAEVLASLHRQGRYRAAPLLRDLLS
jgi:hypothetical protein